MQGFLEYVTGFAVEVGQGVVGFQDEAVGVGVGLILVDGLAQCQEMVGEVLQAVGQLVLVGNPLEILLDGFLLTQVAAEAQNHLVECFLGTLQGLLFHELTGTDVEQSHRRDEEQDDEGDDGSTELQREGVAMESELAHTLPPSFCDTSSSW